MFDLSNVDLAELARNSVQQSSFEHVIKEHFLGTDYNNMLEAKSKNKSYLDNYKKTNVPDSRFKYRQETLRDEYQYLGELIKKK